MCQYSSHDGFANDWHLVHLGCRAVGGAGLVFTEATAVAPEGRISPSDLGIWKEDHLRELKKITSFIESVGSVPGIQLAHAGRKASHEVPWKGGSALIKDAWTTQAPSPIAYKNDEAPPQELTPAQIEKVITAFASAALRALKAGFKILELHGAHGYLIHEFLSPLSNHRTDRYGGVFENRIRFLMEIVESVRKVWPEDLPIFVRISATDWVQEGWTIEDSVALSKILRKAGIDLIDCSSGGNTPKAPIALGPLYQVPFSERIKKESEILTAAVGLITTPQEAESIISSQKADLVFLARQLLRDPYFPLRAAKELSQEAGWPLQYERGKW
ncbi:MAG: NADH:flavin oxidoreductase/NADH oxidase [Flavisolibacter sp.]